MVTLYPFVHDDPRPLRAGLHGFTHGLRLALAATLLAGTAAAGGQYVQILADDGFEPGSQPLLPYTQLTLDRWMHENAALVSGTQNGVTPRTGTGMIAVAQANLTASEVRQRLDVSDLAPQVDAGIVAIETSAWLNPTVAGVNARVFATAFDAGQSNIGFIGSTCTSPDGDTGTWEQFVATFTLPAGTRYVEMRFSATNSTLPIGEFLYVDDASCALYEVLGQLLTDPGLDSGSQPLLPFTQLTNDRWMDENAALVVGPEGGATPIGDGMLRLDPAGGSASEVRQRVDVSAFASDIDAGTMSIQAKGLVNPTVGGTNTRVHAHAYAANQSSLGVLTSPCRTPDADTSTWQLWTATLRLPAGTRYVQFRWSVNNVDIAPTDALYADEAELLLLRDVCGPWLNLGGGTVGTAGAVTLEGSGPLTGNSTATLDLTNTPPSALTLAWLSFAPVPFPALGGTVHAFPYANQFLFVTNPSGALSLSTTWPVGVPPGFNVYFQFLVDDPPTVHDITLSNGLRGTAQ